jgi:hypothetical protein
MKRIRACALAICLLAALPMAAQAPSLTDVYAQIRAEETNHSKIMWIIQKIADVYGPRLTGTPNLKAADMPKPAPEPGPGSEATPVRHIPAASGNGGGVQ